DSRMRYWSYEDSTAYTPSIRYAFFHITDDTTKE
ncbi:amidase domain-containing protein, partial [Peribacillus simplex]